MGENSKIEWCHHTFNPWLGCTKVSPACAHCYAEAWAKRTGIVKWGDSADRRKTTDSYWRQPLKWNAEAARSGERKRVFCASLADVFEDRDELKPWRKELFQLIRITPMLDWLLLTKRPEHANRLMREATPMGSQQQQRRNVWLGTTVESKDEVNRIDYLVNCRQWARVLFLSCEPLLSEIDLFPWLHAVDDFAGHDFNIGIDWVIAGGESGGNASPSHPDWFRNLRDQCIEAKVPFHFKQWGDWGRTKDLTREQRDRAKPIVVFPDGHTEETLRHGAGRTERAAVSWRIGKKASGRLLDGREWNEFPEDHHATIPQAPTHL